MQVYSEPMRTCKATSSGIMQGATMTTQVSVPCLEFGIERCSPQRWADKQKLKKNQNH